MKVNNPKQTLEAPQSKFKEVVKESHLVIILIFLLKLQNYICLLDAGADIILLFINTDNMRLCLKFIFITQHFNFSVV